MIESEVLSEWKDAFERNQAVIFFTGGFLLDAATLNRIDAWVDLLLQFLYLCGIAALLLLQERHRLGLWQPPGKLARVWPFNVEVLHFFYGALFSAYLIFYSKSGANAQSLGFFLVIAALLVFNEFPAARRFGAVMRLGVFALCCASFLIYMVPILVGRIGDGVFLLSLGLAAAAAGAVVWKMGAWTADPRRAWPRLAAGPAAALILLGLFYFERWIPPVPLSLQFTGVYHAVRRDGRDYVASYGAGRWWQFLRREDDPFYARRGDVVHLFLRVYAPVGFEHKLSLVWLHRDSADAAWARQDEIRLPIKGGRRSGFRGVARKEHWRAGLWRVQVRTEDGRLLGEHRFEIRADTRIEPRTWETTRL